jgi:hypothetical protein
MSDTVLTTAVNTATESQILPTVTSWPLAPTTAKMAREIKAILARVHAETDAVVAVDDTAVHETSTVATRVRKSARRPLGVRTKKSLTKSKPSL